MHSTSNIITKTQQINDINDLGAKTEKYQDDFILVLNNKPLSSYCSLRILSRSPVFLPMYQKYCTNTDLGRYKIDNNGNYVIYVKDKITTSNDPVLDFSKFHQFYYFALSMHHGLSNNTDQYNLLPKLNQVYVTNGVKLFCYDVLSYGYNCCKTHDIATPWVVEKCRCLKKIIDSWTVDTQEVDNNKLNEKFTRLQEKMKNNFLSVNEIFNSASNGNITNANTVANAGSITALDKMITGMENNAPIINSTTNTNSGISSFMEPLKSIAVPTVPTVNTNSTIPKALSFADMATRN
jgi:hypothetical protein